MARLNKIDVGAGIFVILIGILAIVESLNFEMGTARRMGPGYFPFYIGVMMLLLGGGIIFESRKPMGEPMSSGPMPSVRSLLLIIGSVACFALIVERFGLVPAVAVAVFLGSLADATTSMKLKLSMTATIPIVCVLIFWLGLDMQVDVFRWRP